MVTFIAYDSVRSSSSAIWRTGFTLKNEGRLVVFYDWPLFQWIMEHRIQITTTSITAITLLILGPTHHGLLYLVNSGLKMATVRSHHSQTQRNAAIALFIDSLLRLSFLPANYILGCLLRLPNERYHIDSTRWALSPLSTQDFDVCLLKLSFLSIGDKKTVLATNHLHTQTQVSSVPSSTADKHTVTS